MKPYRRAYAHRRSQLSLCKQPETAVHLQTRFIALTNNTADSCVRLFDGDVASQDQLYTVLLRYHDTKLLYTIPFQSLFRCIGLFIYFFNS